MPYEVVIELDPDAAGDIEAPVVDGLHTLCVELLTRQEVDPAAEVTIVLTGDQRLHELNREHRDVDEPTDVLSFPAHEGELMPELPPEAREERSHYLGDIAISVPTARRQATEANIPIEDELGHLAIHGLLHLLGHDHETDADDAAMRALEESLLGPHIHASGAHAHDQ